MPTFAKLAAGVAFAVTAWVAAWYYHRAMPPETQIGQMLALSAAIGLLCGWLVMGKLVGQGYRAAMGSGLRTSVTMAVWCLLVFSIVLMLRKASKMRYDGPMEAVVDIFNLALESGRLLLDPNVLAALFVGGLIGGLLAEWAWRRSD